MLQQKHWGLWLLLTSMLAFGIVACVKQIDSSLGFACESNDDCWDDLSCKNELCGGEQRPRSDQEDNDSDANEVSPEGASPEPEPTPEPTPEPPPERRNPPSDPGIPEKTTPDNMTPEGSSPDHSPEVTPEVTPEVAPEPTPEPIAEKTQCKGGVDNFGMCQKDSDCCSGQTCSEIDVPNVGKVKLCGACKEDTDCPMTTKCCKDFGICSLQCSGAPPP